MKFFLRVMTPGSIEDVIEDFESGVPFGAIAVGDLLNLPGRHSGLLKVVGVEHQLSNDADFHHSIRVFTEEAPTRAKSG